MAHQAAPIRRIIWGTNLNPQSITRNAPKVNTSSYIQSMLAQPSWSVRSLLPSEASTEDAQFDRSELHHLLKLSALPLPKSKDEEQRMLRTLKSQIHFVKEIQKIDTSGVEPLVAIRDETVEAIREQTVTLETLQPYLDKEKQIGGNGTVRRQKPTEMIRHSGWDPFEMGKGKETRKRGKYFYVKKQKEKAPGRLQPIT